MWWFILILPFALLLTALLYLIAFQYWYIKKTQGDRYFALPLAQRQKFKETLEKHAIILLPLSRFMAKGIKKRKIPTMSFRHIKAPSAIASPDTFSNAVNYPAAETDIFVATFMKSGTTWMQNIVFEILHHGEGDLSDNGYKHMYALSPWLECSPNASVPIERAPLLSRYKKRLIKTHLPAELCPFNKKTKYIYVSRNPVSTFSSCASFFQMLMGPFLPERSALVNMFCSDNMLWGSWPAHIVGWWNLAQQNDNVLFIRYEDMKKDIDGTLKNIARFLGIDLSPEELQKAAEKASFAYMKTHEFYFEMSPPNVFSAASDIHFMHKGSTQDTDTDKREADKIMAYCKTEMGKHGLPMAIVYPPA